MTKAREYGYWVTVSIFALLCLILIADRNLQFAPDVTTSRQSEPVEQIVDYDTGAHRRNGMGDGPRRLFGALDEVPRRFAGMESTMLTGDQIEALRRITPAGQYFILRDHMAARGLQTAIFNDDFNSYEALLSRHIIDRLRYGVQPISRWWHAKKNSQDFDKLTLVAEIVPDITPPVGPVKIFSTRHVQVGRHAIELVAFAFALSDNFYLSALASFPVAEEFEQPAIYLSFPGCGESLDRRSTHGQIQNRMVQAASYGVIGLHVELFCNNGFMNSPENSFGILNYVSAYGLQFGADNLRELVARRSMEVLKTQFGVQNAKVYPTGHSTSVPTAIMAAKVLPEAGGLVLVAGSNSSRNPLACPEADDARSQDQSPNLPLERAGHFITTGSPWSYWYPENIVSGRTIESRTPKFPHCAPDTFAQLKRLYIIGLGDPTSSYDAFEASIESEIEVGKLYRDKSDPSAYFVFVDGNHNHGLPRSEIALAWIRSIHAGGGISLRETIGASLSDLEANPFIAAEDLFPDFAAWRETGVQSMQDWTQSMIAAHPRRPRNTEADAFKAEVRTMMNVEFWGQASELVGSYVSEIATLSWLDERFKVEFAKIPINYMIDVSATIITPLGTAESDRPILWGSTRYVLPDEQELKELLSQRRPIIVFQYLGHGLARDNAFGTGVLMQRLETASPLHALAYLTVQRILDFHQSRLDDGQVLQALLCADGISDAIYAQIAGSLIDRVSTVHIKNGVRSITEFLNVDPLPTSPSILYAGNIFHRFDLEDFRRLASSTSFIFEESAWQPDWGIF